MRMLGHGCLIVGVVVAQIRHKRAIRKTKLKKLKGFGAEDKTGTQLVLDKVQVKPGLSTAYIDLMQLLP